MYFFNKWWNERTIFHELIRAGILLEVIVDLVETIDTPRYHYDKEGHYTGETLEASIAT